MVDIVEVRERRGSDLGAETSVLDVGTEACGLVMVDVVVVR